MPLTSIDTTAALVVIDLQKGILAIDAVHPVSAVVSRSAELAAAFRDRGLPVVFVNVTGTAPGRTDESRTRGSGPALASDWADLADELDVQPQDLRVTKQRWGAFTGTDLHELLQQRGVTQVVLTGVATSVGVESTARHAHEHGYNVVLATDAMTDRNGDAHLNSVERIFPRLGETAATDEILSSLALASS